MGYIVESLVRTPSNVDTPPDKRGVLISGVVLYTQHTFGTARSVRITVDARIFQGCPHGGVPL